MEKITVNDITFDQPVGDLPEDSDSSDDATQYDEQQAGPGKKICLHFELALSNKEPNKEIIDSNFSKNPVEFTVGDGNLLPGFERSLFGLRPGDEQEISLPAEQAFGPTNPDNIHSFPKTRFPVDLVMERGVVVNFADAAGNEQPGVISNVDETLVEIDFNHPLAGKDILFRVKIYKVSPIATNAGNTD